MNAVHGYTELAVDSPPPATPSLAGGPPLLLHCVWSLQSAGEHERRITPDGCVDVMWGPRAFWIAGPDTRAQLNSTRGGLIVGVRFAPGAAPAALGVPAVELRDARVSLDEVLPEAAELQERVAEALDARGVGVAQRVLARALVARAAERVDEPLLHAARMLSRGAEVSRTAGELGLSERQLHRRSRTAFGYGPKVLQRILRFQRTVRLARGGLAFADVAYDCGYADQAHLAREVRELAGVPLTELLAPADRELAA